MRIATPCLVILALLLCTSVASSVTLEGFIVTETVQTNQTSIFLEKPDRSFGLKVTSLATGLLVGDIVRVVGEMTVVGGQKIITLPEEITKTGHTDILPGFLSVSEKTMIESCNGRGCPVSGLRITTWARVIQRPTRVDPYFGYYFILVDDGTGVYNPQDQSIGYRIYYKAIDYPDLGRDLSEGDFCVLRGVMESCNNLPAIWANSIEKL